MRAVLLLGLLLVACGSGPAASPAVDRSGDDAGTRVLVAAEFSILADLASAVGGDRVEIRTLVPVGADPHMHEPRPSDAMLLGAADIVLEHGLGLAPWMTTLRSNIGGAHVVVGDAVAGHAVVDEEGILDPHLWMDPRMAADYAWVIADALAEVEPAGAAEYHHNAATFARELRELEEELLRAVETIPMADRLLVTPHDGYRYFARRFGLGVLGTLVGASTEEEPSAERMRDLVDSVRSSGVPAVFVESTVPPRLIERVATEAGVGLAGPLYADSVGQPGSGAEDYAGMLRSNTRTIVEALGGRWP